MFHVELRHSRNSTRRFNMTPAEVGHLLEAWVLGRAVQLGERTWLPQQTSLTILEGPRLADHQLSLGRGWRAAQREASDVTQRLLSEAREAFAGAVAPAAGGSRSAVERERAAARGPSELSALLGSDGEALLAVWRRVAERHPSRSPSDCLALAEAELAEAFRGSERGSAH